MAMNGTITLISNAEGGKARTLKIVAGMTLSEIFHGDAGIDDPDKFTVWLNMKVVKDIKTTKPTAGDTVIITPKQVKGNQGN